MANIMFPPLPHSKLSSWMFQGLKGLHIPQRSATNTGYVGTFLDNYIKTQLNISNINSVVDLERYGIEVKSKDISTNTDWSIGSMTLEDILTTPYQVSSVYRKLQALLLIDTDDVFQIVKDIGLYYFDFDEVQILLEDSYNDVRSQIQQVVNEHAKQVAKEIAKGNTNAVLNKVQFSNYAKFQSDYGKFESMNNGSFQFRLTQSQMRHLTTLASIQSSVLVYD